jgi:hypothetical protein
MHRRQQVSGFAHEIVSAGCRFEPSRLADLGRFAQIPEFDNGPVRDDIRVAREPAFDGDD